MKKLWLITGALLLSLALVACGGAGETSDSTSSETTPSSTTSTETTTETTPDPDVETEKTEDYTAVLRDFAWTESGIDSSEFDFFGSGTTVANSVNLQYNAYQRTFYQVARDGTKTEITSLDLRKQSTVGVKATADEAAKTCEINVYPFEVKVESAWASVTARAGSYLMFEFTTNLPTEFYMTVTATEGGDQSSAAYTQGGVTVSGENGKYTGTAKCTVPYDTGKTYYINICLDNESAKYPVMASIPVTITTAKYDSPYSLLFQGDWELIRDKEYLGNLIDLFYNVYPRLYERFGDGSEPKTITFMADKSYEGVAYCSGTLVCVSVAYANSNPTDIGFFAHEITHSVQQYGNKMYYGDGAWWTEFMADLGRFRYFHWGYSTKYVKFYSMDDPNIRDFGWEPYGQHNIFAAYLDSRYPTTKDEDGNITLGLVDAINKMIKESTTTLSDDPYKVGTPFNNKVKEITGFETMEALRLHFVEELDAGTWTFIGFADYEDNFRTEGIIGVPDPTYPMNIPVEKGNITHPILATPVTEGTNIAWNATVVDASAPGMSKNVVANLFDGDLNTKWQAAVVKSDYKYVLAGYQHEVVIDLGEAKAFNTYTLVNAGEKENAYFNTEEWELLISNDGETWTSVDYQTDVNQNVVSVNVGEQTARYVMLRIFSADRSNAGTARIYEWMLFKK